MKKTSKMFKRKRMKSANLTSGRTTSNGKVQKSEPLVGLFIGGRSL